jgi:putative oxidoreductase
MRPPTLPLAYGITIVRVMAGIIICVAGIEKLGGPGFSGWAKAMAGYGFPVPEFWGVFIPLLELIGGALLALGLGARWVAILFVIEYIGTGLVIKTTRQPPFGGWDSMRIDLMLLASAIMLVLVGPGALALESVVRRARGRAAQAQVGRRPVLS